MNDFLDEDQEASMESGGSSSIKYPPFKYTLKKGESGAFTMLSEKAETVLVMPVSSNRQYPDWVPCEPGSHEDEKKILCATVIDHNEYTTAKGVKVPANQLRLLCASPYSVKGLQEISKEFGGLKGQTIKVKRSTSDKAPAIGDTFVRGKQPDKVPTPMIGKHTLEEARKLSGFSQFYNDDGTIKAVAALTPSVKEDVTKLKPGRGIDDGIPF